MATTLDLGLAIRIVEKFYGDAIELENWLNDVTVLHEGQSTVAEATIVKFLSNRLVGTARGTLTRVDTIEGVKTTLRARFGIKLTPIAVTAVLKGLKQKNKSLVKFGEEVEKISTKLAAAWVSKEPTLFPTETAARPIVEPIAVEAFITGLKEQARVFPMRARNTLTLTEAVSAALEIHAQPMPEEVMWTYTGYNNSGYRGRGRGKGGKKGNRGYPNNYNQQGYN